MRIIAGTAILLSALVAAQAMAEPLAPKPYQPVAITPPPASDDAGLIAFRRELAAVAKGRVYADLARLVDTQFFWDRDFGGGFDPRKAAVDNLAAAIRLEHRNGAGWDALAVFAAEAAAAPLVSRQGAVCAPAPPGYDGIALTRLLDITRTDAADWAYPRAADRPVRAAPEPGAPPIGALGLHLVRVLGIEGSDGEPLAGRRLWARVALPTGAIGFVAPGELWPFAAARLCYAQDMFGRWRIAGYVSAGNY